MSISSLSFDISSPSHITGVKKNTDTPSQNKTLLPDSGTDPAFASLRLNRAAGAHLSTFNGESSEQTAAAFAADITRRIASGDETDMEELTRLEEALSRTISSARSLYGARAATAIMGAVYKKIGDDNVTEESLGAGFLDAIRLIDRNFGFSAGDSFMENLNGDLNNAMNDFFDNGANETFYAVSSADKMAMVNERAVLAAKEVGEAVGGLLEAISNIAQDGVNAARKKPLLKELQEELEKKIQEKLEDSRWETTLEAYEASNATTDAGELVDITI